MKKVLALVLAVMMLATMAFAVDTKEPDATDPGSATIKVNGSILPGSKIRIGQKGIIDVLDSGAKRLEEEDIKAINSTNYTITGKKFTEGQKQVKGVYFDDDNDQLVIEIVQNYKQTTAKELDMYVTLKGKTVGRNVRNKDIYLHVQGEFVSYTLADGKNDQGWIRITPDGEVVIEGAKFIVNASDKLPDRTTGGTQAFSEEGADEFVWKVVKDDVIAYGDLEFTAADGDTDVVVRVYDGNKFYLYSNVEADKDVLKKYADVDADLTFLNFPGKPEFDANATVYFYKEEGTYIYENKGDGVLSPITARNAGAAGQVAGNVKWDEDLGSYVLKTRTLTKYVFSDKPLATGTTAGTAGSANPDTGANDVVGVATALAAVALVSAAAVSLKK